VGALVASFGTWRWYPSRAAVNRKELVKSSAKIDYNSRWLVMGIKKVAVNKRGENRRYSADEADILLA
jgi:hypothetical protein